MSLPKLSIVIACHNAERSVQKCISAVASQCVDIAHEIIVVDNSRDASSEIIKKYFPNVELLNTNVNYLVPQLWAKGIQKSSGEIVAITTADFVPQRDWVSQILNAHRSDYVGIGGAIENEPAGGVLSWAIYFCRYKHYMLPFKQREVEDFAGDNASYKRKALDACESLWRDGFWEPDVHRVLLKNGGRLLLTPKIVVEHQRSFSFLSFLNNRFLHGRQYGRARVSDLSPGSQLSHLGFSILVPWVLLGRIVKEASVRKRHFLKLVSSFPVLICFLFSWSAGETIGYASCLCRQRSQ